MCKLFLTTEKFIQVKDDVGGEFRLIELLDGGSLMYLSIHVIKITRVISEIFFWQ